MNKAFAKETAVILVFELFTCTRRVEVYTSRMTVPLMREVASFSIAGFMSSVHWDLTAYGI